MKSLGKLCILVGALKLAQYPYDLYRGADIQYRREPLDLKKRYGGGYVVVTGGTDGLGKSFAKSFADLGFNLIIVARNEEKLDRVKQELESNYKINVETILFDFSTGDLAKYEELNNKLQKFDISVLLNNVAGFSEKSIGQYENLGEMKDLIYTNCLSYSLMTKYLLPKLKARESNSAVIDIGSQSAERSFKHGFNLFFATKAFTNQFSDSMVQETLNEKIDYTSVKPGLVLTKMLSVFNSKINESFGLGLILEDPDYFAERTLRALGHDRIIYGSERSAFMNYILKNFSPLSSYVLGQN